MSVRVKHENLESNKLIKVKFPPQRETQVETSRVSPSSEGMQGASSSLYGGNVTLIKPWKQIILFLWIHVSGSKHFHLLLLDSEIKISRKFEEEIVRPILKVKLNFHHKKIWGVSFLKVMDYVALVKQQTESWTFFKRSFFLRQLRVVVVLFYA